MLLHNHHRLEPYICDPELMLPDPAGIPYMESDTQPPMNITASEDDEVYSSLEEQYGVAKAKNVVHQLEKKIPNNIEHDGPELLSTGENLVDDLIEASMTDTTLQATANSQEGVVGSSSSNVVINTLSNLWTSAWGSWQS